MNARAFRLLLFIVCLSAGLASVRLTQLSAAAAGEQQDNQTPDVTVNIDRARATVGDPISLTVTIKHLANVTIDTTSIDDQLGSLEPIASDPPDDRPAGGGMELRLRYKLASYHTGTVELPVLTFTYTLPDGTQAQVQSKAPVPITIQSVLPDGADPTDIRPLKQQFSLPVPASEQLLWIIGGGGIPVAFVVVAVLSYLLIWRKRPPQSIAVRHATQAARAELDRIMGLGLLERGELLDHYRQLANCVRRYLTERYGFAAVALTTGELERQMEARGIARWPARLISGVLSECDAVVYARYQPAAVRSEADNAMAYEILDATDDAGVAPKPMVQAV